MEKLWNLGTSREACSCRGPHWQLGACCRAVKRAEGCAKVTVWNSMVSQSYHRENKIPVLGDAIPVLGIKLKRGYTVIF